MQFYRIPTAKLLTPLRALQLGPLQQYGARLAEDEPISRAPPPKYEGPVLPLIMTQPTGLESKRTEKGRGPNKEDKGFYTGLT